MADDLPLSDRARQIAAAPFAYASADITAIIEELLGRLDAHEAPQTGRCGYCNGTGRRYPHVQAATLAHSLKCPACAGAGRS